MMCVYSTSQVMITFSEKLHAQKHDHSKTDDISCHVIKEINLGKRINLEIFNEAFVFP